MNQDTKIKLVVDGDIVCKKFVHKGEIVKDELVNFKNYNTSGCTTFHETIKCDIFKSAGCILITGDVIVDGKIFK